MEGYRRKFRRVVFSFRPFFWFWYNLCDLPQYPMNRAEILQHERAFYTAYAQEFRERSRRGYITELLPYPHFVVWRHEILDGQPKKPPYDPNRKGRHADTTDKHTWGTFTQALSALESGSFNGIGFVVSPTDPFTMIDLDECVHGNRRIDAWAQAVINEVAT